MGPVKRSMRVRRRSSEWAACQRFFLYGDVAPALRALATRGLKIGDFQFASLPRIVRASFLVTGAHCCRDLVVRAMAPEPHPAFSGRH